MFPFKDVELDVCILLSTARVQKRIDILHKPYICAWLSIAFLTLSILLKAQHIASSNPCPVMH